MTEPDEALTAFRNWACVQFPKIRVEIQEGLFDGTSAAHAYRAGQAASAERIKALEEALRGGLDAVGQAQAFRVQRGHDRRAEQFNRFIRAWKAEARALLKEADQ